MRTSYRNQIIDKTMNKSSSPSPRNQQKNKTSNGHSDNNNDQKRKNHNNNSKFYDNIQLGDSSEQHYNINETNSIVSARSVSSLILRKLSPERKYDIPIDGKLIIPKLITIDLWSNDPIIILSTLEELGHLCHPEELNCINNRKLIHNIGGHLAYSVLMKKWNHRCDIQFRTICAIGVSCMDYDDFCIASIQVGVLESIIIAMKNYYYDEYIQLSGCGTLVVLINSSSNSTKIIKSSNSGGSGIKRTISNGSNNSTSSVSSVLLNNDNSNGNITHHDPKNAEHLVYHLQAHIVVMNAIKLYPNNLHLQGIVCELLLSLCEFEQLKHPIVQAGALRILGFIVEANTKENNTPYPWNPTTTLSTSSQQHQRQQSNDLGTLNNNNNNKQTQNTYELSEETAVLTLARKAMQHLLEK